MHEEEKTKLRFEIGHVLFIDIVGYSKLLISEQSEQIQKLKEIVRGTEQFRVAQAEGRLLRLPTGDGGALVFRTSPEAPAMCAMEISKELKNHPELRVRMGIHSGPVNEISDLNEQANIAGAGINIAQRVMDCGDAGHILLSKHVADDLEQYPRWRPVLHDLGECEVKHGARVSVVNLYTDELGNPQVPERFKTVEAAVPAATKTKSARFPWHEIVIAILLIGAVIAGVVMFRMIGTARKSVDTAVAQDSGRAGSASLLVSEKNVAVLPFDNLSRDPDNAFFTDGVQDEILTHLAKIADLKVISRTSVMQYKTGIARNLREIGQQLGVAHLLKGSVQRAANKVRVNAQLIDVRTDAHLWAQTYDRDLADVFAIQSEISKAIADQLQAKISPSEKKAMEQPPTTDPIAFDLYSRAKNLLLTAGFSTLGQQNLRHAVDLLHQALARDSSFFLAQCQLAYTHDNLYFLGYDHTPTRLAEAEVAVQAAFRLRPDAGEAHLARAEHLYRAYLDYDKALAELEIARRTLPNDPRVFELLGYIARRQNKQEEGLRNLERAIELDPRNFFTLQQIALSYQLLRRFAETANMLDRAVAVDPDNVETRVVRAQIDLDWKANTRPLHQAIEQVRQKDPTAISRIADTVLFCALAERNVAAAEAARAALGDNTFGNNAVQFSPEATAGFVARMAGDEKKARAAFTAAHERQEKFVQAQPEYGPGVCMLGVIQAGLGRKEEALRNGRRAVELLPVAKDSINGAHMIEYLAMIAAWVGEKDLACEQLAIATKLPGTLSYGQLKLLPFWDPLRGDPRFEKIVASLAPKDDTATAK